MKKIDDTSLIARASKDMLDGVRKLKEKRVKFSNYK